MGEKKEGKGGPINDAAHFPIQPRFQIAHVKRRKKKKKKKKRMMMMKIPLLSFPHLRCEMMKVHSSVVMSLVGEMMLQLPALIALT